MWDWLCLVVLGLGLVLTGLWLRLRLGFKVGYYWGLKLRLGMCGRIGIASNFWIQWSSLVLLWSKVQVIFPCRPAIFMAFKPWALKC